MRKQKQGAPQDLQNPSSSLVFFLFPFACGVDCACALRTRVEKSKNDNIKGWLGRGVGQIEIDIFPRFLVIFGPQLV